jgi:hypothetical protein
VSDAIVFGPLEPTVLVSIQPDGVGRTTSIYLLANATVERVLFTNSISRVEAAPQVKSKSF